MINYHHIGKQYTTPAHKHNTQPTAMMCAHGDMHLELATYTHLASNDQRVDAMKKYVSKPAASASLRTYHLTKQTIAARCEAYMFLNLMMMRHMLCRPRVDGSPPLNACSCGLVSLPPFVWRLVVGFSTDHRIQLLYALQLTTITKPQMQWVIRRLCPRVSNSVSNTHTTSMFHDDRSCPHYRHGGGGCVCPSKMLLCAHTCLRVLGESGRSRGAHCADHLRAIAFYFSDSAVVPMAKRTRLLRYLERQHAATCDAQAARRAGAFSQYHMAVSLRPPMPDASSVNWVGHVFRMASGKLSVMQRLLWPIWLPLAPFVREPPDVVAMCYHVTSAHRSPGFVISCVLLPRHMLMEQAEVYGSAWCDLPDTRMAVASGVMRARSAESASESVLLQICMTPYADGYTCSLSVCHPVTNQRSMWLPAVVLCSSMQHLHDSFSYHRKKQPDECWRSATHDNDDRRASWSRWQLCTRVQPLDIQIEPSGKRHAGEAQHSKKRLRPS